VWLLPQGPQVPAAFEGVCHLHAEAFFAGPFPLGVIRVCCACEFDLPVHGHVPCTTEREVVGVPLGTRACPHEGPLASVVRANVLLPTPRPDVFGGLRVAQDPRRLQMAVSTVMQVAWRTTWRCECAHPRITGLRWAISWPAVVGLVACTMARRCPRHLCLCVRAGLMRRVPAYVRRGCPRKSQPSSRAVRGGRRRTFQPAFAPPLGHERVDRVCQAVGRTPCTNAVVTGADPMHCGVLGAFRVGRGVGFAPFCQAVQRQLGHHR